MSNRSHKYEMVEKFQVKSDRVKGVHMHPVETWILGSMYNGNVHMWNYETKTLVKTLEVSNLPVRISKFVVRKNWIVTGSDDFMIRVFNHNTYEKHHSFEAHGDYIRCLDVHPSKPYIVTGSDDLSIKLWDWEKGWTCVKVFEGHLHYVMDIAFNPKDVNTFASASLDSTIKMWSLGSDTPNFTLEGHERGVCTIAFYTGTDRSYIASGCDDRSIKIWDYQNKNCVQTLLGHTNNITSLYFHPTLPLLISGSEDETIRTWNVNNFTQEYVHSHGMERVWCISGSLNSNLVALGFDNGVVVVQIGKEEPAISMDGSGRIVWARNNEIFAINTRNYTEEVSDGVKMIFQQKGLGSCEIHPTSLSHSPNGRFVSVLGDGEYNIYTALAWRSKTFGKADGFCWSSDSDFYAILKNKTISIFKNFASHLTFDVNANNIFGGFLLSVSYGGNLHFRSWNDGVEIGKINVNVKDVFWSDSGECLCISSYKDGLFFLRYHKEVLESDDSQGPFELVFEINENIVNGCWIGCCFVFTTVSNRLMYYIGGYTNTISHLDQTMYVLEYVIKSELIYLCDKSCGIYPYFLSMSSIDYQTHVISGEMDKAKLLLSGIPSREKVSISRFLSSRGYKEEALEVTNDIDQKFELAIDLKRIDVLMSIIDNVKLEQKWVKVSRVFLEMNDIDSSRSVLERSKNYSDLFLVNFTNMDYDGMKALSRVSKDNNSLNSCFFSNIVTGNIEESYNALIASRLYPEAALFARTYCPDRVKESVSLWKSHVKEKYNTASDKNGIRINDYSERIGEEVSTSRPFIEKKESNQKEKTLDIPIDDNSNSCAEDIDSIALESLRICGGDKGEDSTASLDVFRISINKGEKEE